MKLLFLLLLISTNLYSSGDIEKSIEYGMFDEYYPEHPVAPHAKGIYIKYNYEQLINNSWQDIKNIYVSYDIAARLEQDAELYDSDRDAISLEFNLKVVHPISKGIIKKSIVAGIDLQENGPQINDRFYMGHTGIEIEKEVQVALGKLLVNASVEAAYVYYEVDDESSRDQNGPDKNMLSHFGGGGYVKLTVQYSRGKNKIRFLMSRVQTDDDDQKIDDYTRNSKSIEISRDINEKVNCGIRFSEIEHEYLPIALIHNDELYQANINCNIKF